MYRWNVQVTAYGQQTVPDWGVVRSCDPLQNFGAPIVSGWQWHITNKRAWLWSRDCFKILPLVVMQCDARVCQRQLSHLFCKHYSLTSFHLLFWKHEWWCVINRILTVLVDLHIVWQCYVSILCMYNVIFVVHYVRGSQPGELLQGEVLWFSELGQQNGRLYLLYFQQFWTK